MGEAWKSASGGQIELRIYPGGVVGDEPDMVRKMRIDELQAAALTGGGLQVIAPDVLALMMPMMLRSDAELDYVRDHAAPDLEKILEAQGFKVLNWGDVGWVRFFTQKPVIGPDDLKSLKLFVWAGDTATFEAWKACGYHPVALAATDILTGLESGLINAVPTTPLAALSFQWFGVAPHMTDIKWQPLVGATVISMRTWNAIPDALKPRLLQSARDIGARLRQQARPLEGQAIAAMVSHGLMVHEVAPDIAAVWEERANACLEKIIGPVVPAAMVDKVKKFRDEYRAQHGNQ
jgi:TRAP-type C4-dicarboxylate transport system substrate-binding protein